MLEVDATGLRVVKVANELNGESKLLVYRVGIYNAMWAWFEISARSRPGPGSSKTLRLY